jgi:hypothetical protein
MRAFFQGRNRRCHSIMDPTNTSPSVYRIFVRPVAVYAI